MTQAEQNSIYYNLLLTNRALLQFIIQLRDTENIEYENINRSIQNILNFLSQVENHPDSNQYGIKDELYRIKNNLREFRLFSRNRVDYTQRDLYRDITDTEQNITNIISYLSERLTPPARFQRQITAASTPLARQPSLSPPQRQRSPPPRRSPLRLRSLSPSPPPPLQPATLRDRAEGRKTKKTRKRKTRGRKTRGRKTRGRKTRGRKTRGRKTRGRK